MRNGKVTYNYSSDQNKCSRINGADAIIQLWSRERSSRVHSPAEFMRKKAEIDKESESNK